MTEERARFEVLLENVQREMRVIAEGHGALAEGLGALTERLDRIETKVDTVERKVDTLAGDLHGVQGRLKRIEGHLQLNGSSPRRKATRASPPKRRKKL